MYGGDPNVHTTFTGDATLVTAAAKQANAATASVVDSTKSIASEAEAASVSYSGLKSSLTAVRQGIAAIGTAIAAAFAVVKLIDFFNTLDERLAKSRREFSAAANDFAADVLLTARTPDASALEREIQNIQKSTREQTERITKDAESKLTDFSQVALRQVGLAPSRGDVLKDAQAAIDTVKRANEERERLVRERIENEQRLTAEAQQKEALDRERAEDDRDTAKRLAQEKDQKDQRKAADDLEDALVQAAANFGSELRKQIQDAAAELQRLNDAFVNSQNSTLITSINRLTDTINATGGVGRFDGPETSFR